MSDHHREHYDRSIHERLALLAEQGIDSCVDALQAMQWAHPADDDLLMLYSDANSLSDRITRYRDEGGMTDR